MTPQDLYRAKLFGADEAVSTIGSGMNVAMGMAVAEPPACRRRYRSGLRRKGWLNCVCGIFIRWTWQREQF